MLVRGKLTRCLSFDVYDRQDRLVCRDWTIVSGAERRVYVPCVERPLRSLQLSVIWLSIEERVVPLEPAVIKTSYAYYVNRTYNVVYQCIHMVRALLCA